MSLEPRRGLPARGWRWGLAALAFHHICPNNARGPPQVRPNQATTETHFMHFPSDPALPSRRTALHTAAATGLAGLMASLGDLAHAQAAQVETLKIITGFAAGGTSDTLCRRLATKMSPDFAR